MPIFNCERAIEYTPPNIIYYNVSVSFPFMLLHFTCSNDQWLSVHFLLLTYSPSSDTIFRDDTYHSIMVSGLGSRYGKPLGHSVGSFAAGHVTAAGDY